MVSPASSTRAQNGVHCQMSISAIETKAQVGSPSHSTGPIPTRPRNQFTTPKSRLKISRPISPTTA